MTPGGAARGEGGAKRAQKRRERGGRLATCGGGRGEKLTQRHRGAEGKGKKVEGRSKEEERCANGPTVGRKGVERGARWAKKGRREAGGRNGVWGAVFVLTQSRSGAEGGGRNAQKDTKGEIGGERSAGGMREEGVLGGVGKVFAGGGFWLRAGGENGRIQTSL